MDNGFSPMFGAGPDVDFEFGIPQSHDEMSAKEQRDEQKRMEKLEVESTLLAELHGQGGAIVKRIVNQTVLDLNSALLGNLTDEQIILIIKQVRWNLHMLQDSLGLTSMFENSTKHTILSFVMEILNVSLPQTQGYQAPFNQQKVAPDGIPTE